MVLGISGLAAVTIGTVVYLVKKGSIQPGSLFSNKRSWYDFVPFLEPVLYSRYSLEHPEIPVYPPGTDFLPDQYAGNATTNCSVFTGYFLGNGFQIPFTQDDWLEWQVAKGLNRNVYKGYGPFAADRMGMGTLMPQGSKPVDGVYLIQSFRAWPSGHSWLVLDYDPATDQMLTLEANTAYTGLDGVGALGIGPLRSSTLRDWKQKSNTTWSNRTSGQEIFMTKLNIDPKSVRKWISEH